MYPARSVESSTAGNYLSSIIGSIASKDQRRRVRFMGLTCSTLTDGLSDARNRNAGSERKDGQDGGRPDREQEKDKER